MSRKPVTMQLFKKLGKARKKWHRKALLIDPNKTRILIVGACVEPKHVPSWMQRTEPDSPAKELLSLAKNNKEFLEPFQLSTQPSA